MSKSGSARCTSSVEPAAVLTSQEEGWSSADARQRRVLFRPLSSVIRIITDIVGRAYSSPGAVVRTELLPPR